MVKFLREIVQGMPDFVEGEGKYFNVILTVMGELTDGTPFSGTDTIKALKR